MASWVGIANLALTHIGSEPILSLEDDTAPARACAGVIAAVTDAVLREHPWTCAVRRARLAADAAPPAFGYAYAYQLPADPYCLRVLDVWDQPLPWQVEGRKLLTDATPPLSIRYVARITDPEMLDASLAQAVAVRLAAAVAYKITQSRQLADDLWKLYEATVPLARSTNAREIHEADPPSSFVRWRY